jgi:hypothetical protein
MRIKGVPLEEEAASNVRQLYRKSRSGSVALPYR